MADQVKKCSMQGSSTSVCNPYSVSDIIWKIQGRSILFYGNIVISKNEKKILISYLEISNFMTRKKKGVLQNMEIPEGISFQLRDPNDWLEAHRHVLSFPKWFSLYSTSWWWCFSYSASISTSELDKLEVRTPPDFYYYPYLDFPENSSWLILIHFEIVPRSFWLFKKKKKTYRI